LRVEAGSARAQGARDGVTRQLGARGWLGVAGRERGAAGRRASAAAFQWRKVTRAGDLASGPMLGLGSSPHERTGQGPSWAGDMVST
jgi:hypothetical protein